MPKIVKKRLILRGGVGLGGKNVKFLEIPRGQLKKVDIFSMGGTNFFLAKISFLKEGSIPLTNSFVQQS